MAGVVALLLAACEVRTELQLTAEEDGSGVLSFGVGLDDDALAAAGDAADLRPTRLAASGWTVTGPAAEPDGLTWIRAERAFSDPDEVGALVAELGGDDGPFRDLELRRRSSALETEVAFSGTVDFTSGQDDAPDLSGALGDDAARRIERGLAAAVDELVSVEVAVRLPGSVTSNAPTKASNGAVWRPSVLEPAPVELRATGTVRHTGRLVSLAAGAAAIAGLLAAGVVALRRRRA